EGCRHQAGCLHRRPVSQGLGAPAQQSSRTTQAVVRLRSGGTGMRRGPSSSAMLLSITVIMLGAVMLKFSGASHLAILLSVLVLGMGLASMVVLLLRSSRAEEAACDPPRDSTAAGVAHEP